MSKDQRSPKKSSVVLIGQPDLLFVIFIRVIIYGLAYFALHKYKELTLNYTVHIEKTPIYRQDESLLWDLRPSFHLLLKS